MPLIDDIVATINSLAISPDGLLMIGSIQFNNNDFVNAFFTKLIRKDSITLSKASIKSQSEKSVTVSGVSDIWVYKKLDISLTFSAKDDQITATILCTFPPDKKIDKKIQLPVLSWINIGNLSITASIAQPFNISNFSYGANILLEDGATVPVVITSLPNNDWDLSIAEGTNAGINGEQLVALLCRNALISFLPKPLVEVLDTFTLCNIDAMFNTESKKVDYFSAGVTVNKGWEIVPNVVSLLPGLHLQLTLLNPTDSAMRQIVGTVSGTFVLNKTTLPVFVCANAGMDNSWSFGIQPGEKVTLPSFSDLLSLAGDKQFLDSLPSGLSTIPKIEIDTLRVSFDTDKKILTELVFSVKTTSIWKVIEGYFEVNSLSVAFEINNLNDSPSRSITGMVRCLFCIGKVPLICEIDKKAESGWSITGGLAPGMSVDIVQVAASLFEKIVTLPDNLPIISFSVLTLTVTPAQGQEKGKFSFTAKSGNEWPIIANFSIKSFALNFTRSVSNGKSQIEGHIAGTLCIAKVDLSLSAKLGDGKTGGCLFEGKSGEGQKIEIIELITDLAKNLGATAPEPLASLSVNNLSVSYQTKTKAFHCGCECDLTIEDKAVSVHITIDSTPTSNQSGGDSRPTYETKFSGSLTIANLQFAIVFDSKHKFSAFVATYSPENGDPKKIKIKELVQSISSDLANAVPESLEVQLNDVKFVFFKQGDTKQFSVGLSLGSSINLSNLPLIGNKLPSNLSIGVDHLQLLYSNKNFTKEQVSGINTLFPEKVCKLPADGMPKGIQISGDIQLGELKKSLKVPDTKEPSTRALAVSSKNELSPDTEADATSNITWFNVQKQFGPVQFQRIGVEFDNSILSFALDASIVLGPVSIAMAGLTVGSPISEFKPVFDLHGLGLAYSVPPLTIMGGIVKSKPGDGVEFQYDGMISVHAMNWGLAALASYAQMTGGMPSLFVFARLDAKLGGPPYFVVEGFMGGFGFNRHLQMPEFNEVADFPFLAIGGAQKPGQKSGALEILNILDGNAGKTKRWIQPKIGDYWLAVGLQFSSCELIHGEMLLLAEFGHDLQFGLLGLASMQLPRMVKPEMTFVFVELQLAAILKPVEGYFGVSATLTSNSYIICKDCHLTGGFAFSLWFGAHANAGQFVFTMGGYHPAFKRPSYYPDMPRLGINWAVSSVVSIKGGAYLALTPSCGMAGGELEILFQSGDLRAWFTAQADMLFAWHPCSFNAVIHVEIGVSYNLSLPGCHKTISASVGASLNLWGPPTGGLVKVHVVGITFTVAFGSESAEDKNHKALDWDDFKALLPAPATLCTISAGKGLYKTLEKSPANTQNDGCDKSLDAAGGNGKIWLVRGGGFSFFTESAIPAGENISVRPMNLKGVNSSHKVTLFKNGVQIVESEQIKWKTTPNTTTLPETLWGAPITANGKFVQNPVKPTADVIANQVTGYTFTAPEPMLGATPGMVALTAIGVEYIKPPIGAAQNPFSMGIPVSPDFLPVYTDDTISDIAGIASASIKRASILNVLASNQYFTGTDSTMSIMAASAGDLFADTPMEQV
ncbi:MAG: hypothetical protein HGA97_09515 [Chlorobiaceae bacterium]|nr:hypothetical protein [Chlorobiaceae bacterium]